MTADRMENPLTIVEVTGRLGIGGVETHVSRLARGLIRRGHRVILLTQDSGVYGAEAESAGAELVVLPFDRQGQRQALAELEARTVDLVHAHNYRAARFGAPLARALGVPYIMTVHGPRPWLKRALFRDWSDPVLTVSEADRDNIVGPLGISADRVVVGFLGVDTDRFKPGLDASSLRAEWDVPNDCLLILNVTRFTHRKARPALALIEALPLVRAEALDVRLVLVGEGGELDRLSLEAAKLNRSAGTTLVTIAGPRTDIPLVMNTGDLVVATATTATESLACATPTIAFGRTGYFGLVTPDNFERARAVCFADHGHLRRDLGADELAGDLVSLLSDLPAARMQAAEVRKTITERYNVESMVEQIESVYRDVVEHSDSRCPST
jgi:glycosyltransferase involved in cell wall biosynthesis